MKTHQYELIDEKVFEHEFDNGLKLFIIPKPGFQNVCDPTQHSLVHWTIILSP